MRCYAGVAWLSAGRNKSSGSKCVPPHASSPVARQRQPTHCATDHCVAAGRSCSSRLRQPRISSIRPSPMQQHRPHANKSILHPINVFRKYIISLEGWEQIQWSTSYILSQARLVQVRIRCLLYVNFRAMYSLHSKKCNSRFLKIQIILTLIKFILKTTNIYIFKFF